MEIRPEIIIGPSYLLLPDEHRRRGKLELPCLVGSGRSGILDFVSKIKL